MESAPYLGILALIIFSSVAAEKLALKGTPD